MSNENKITDEEIKREARIKIIKIASLFIASAVILACYSYTKVESFFLQVILYGISSFVTFLSAMFISGTLALGRAEKNRHNFFLYDRKIKSEMPISSLTVARIREKLLEFMSVFKRRGKLYVGELFSDNPAIPEHFKTLFCYEILYEIATDDGMDAAAFLGFGGECADIFSRYLRENEDYELATSLRGFMFEFSSENNNSEGFKEYIKAKKEHIESKMLGYTVKNIEKFR